MNISKENSRSKSYEKDHDPYREGKNNIHRGEFEKGKLNNENAYRTIGST